MNIVSRGTFYEVESASKNGKFYKVDPVRKTCSCPAFLYRYSKVGLPCKHIDAVLDQAGEQTENSSHEIIDYVKEKGEIETIEGLDKFGEDAVNAAIGNGDLIETKGKLRILK